MSVQVQSLYEDRLASFGTYTGKLVYPLDMAVEDIDIVDIGHALSNQCRWTGHCREFYSVAQHSALVCEAMLKNGSSFRDALWGLLHDASEAYLVDLAQPLKRAEDFGRAYRAAEDGLMLAICFRFYLPLKPPAAVHRYDQMVGASEARDLMLTGRWAPQYPAGPLSDTIEPWPPSTAKAVFLGLYEMLTAEPA